MSQKEIQKIFIYLCIEKVEDIIVDNLNIKDSPCMKKQHCHSLRPRGGIYQGCYFVLK